MGAAGTLDRRCAFQRPAVTTGGLGDERTGWSPPFMTVWGQLRYPPGARGRELIASGQVRSRRQAALTIRNSAAAREVTTADSVTIDGVRWDIRSTATEAVDRAYIHLIVETDA